MREAIKVWLRKENEIEEIADHSMELPDYTNNPRLATRDEVFKILKKAFRY